MANITDIWLITQNSTTKSAETSDYLELQVITSGKDIELDTNIANSTNGDSTSLNSNGKAGQFWWSVAAGDFKLGEITTNNIQKFDLDISGKDGWLPDSIWVITLDSNGNYYLNVANGSNWTQGMSKDPNDWDGTAVAEVDLGGGNTDS